MIEWEVTYYDPKKGKKYARLRATFKQANLLVYVGTDGWEYKNETQKVPENTYRMYETGDKQVRLSMNGPIMLTWPDWCEIKNKIEEVYGHLVALRHT